MTIIFFAVKVMQLFTVGTVLLNMDGTPKLDENTGNQILTYTNDHIMSYARAWTGFYWQERRGNVEHMGGRPNRIDPMQIDMRWRDVFPKIDLEGGYVGDGYQLCTDMPKRSFLTKGAIYRLLGSSTTYELTHNPASAFNFDPTVKMMKLDPSSDLYNALCNPSTVGGNDCRFKSQVKITENLICTGQECDVDSVNLIEVTTGIYFEYVRQACVELTYYQNPTTITWPFRNVEMCGNPKSIVAREACCTSGATDALAVKCEYANERVTLETAEVRCASLGQEVCNYRWVRAGALDAQCGAFWFYYHWHKSDCLLQVKVQENTGYAAVVHKPTAMINENLELLVRSNTISYFPVYWASDNYPDPTNNCGNGLCEAIEGGCLCNTAVTDDVVFSSDPVDVDDVLSQLRVGSPSPDTFDDGHYDSPVTKGDYQVYFRSGTSSYDIDTVFRVEVNSQVKYYKNIVSTVGVVGQSGQTSEFAFRNPPHFVNFASGDERDAHHETEAVLKSYFYHPNMAPKISSYMIQKFGISNPSPRYVETVALAFKNGIYNYSDGAKPVISFGTNTYGDMQSTIAAIILDREARSVVLDYDPSKGSLREPLIKVINFMRAMEYAPLDGFRYKREQYGLDSMTGKIGQMAFDIKDVFSYFRPEYSPTGPIHEASLVAPEAQQYMTPSVVGLVNGLFSLIKYGMAFCFGGFGGFEAWCGLEDEGGRNLAWGEITLTPENINDNESVVNELATLLTAGRLNSQSRDIIKNEIAGIPDADARFRLAQQLVVISPEFHSTNLVQFTGVDRAPPDEVQPSSRPYKAVVYFLAAGGMDSFNLLVPYSGCSRDMYTEYVSVRGEVSIARAQLKPIATGAVPQICSFFGIYPDLPVLQELYNSKDLVSI